MVSGFDDSSFEGGEYDLPFLARANHGAPAGNGRRQSPHAPDGAPRSAPANASVPANTVVVHMLLSGRMACGQDGRPPAEWDKGQLWVRSDMAHLVSCAGCLKKARELGRIKPRRNRRG